MSKDQNVRDVPPAMIEAAYMAFADEAAMWRTGADHPHDRQSLWHAARDRFPVGEPVPESFQLHRALPDEDAAKRLVKIAAWTAAVAAVLKIERAKE